MTTAYNNFGIRHANQGVVRAALAPRVLSGISRADELQSFNVRGT
jgi:hypothetical protein